MDIGFMINEVVVEKSECLLNDVVSKGVKVLIGGECGEG